jgi:hypothetical protein
MLSKDQARQQLRLIIQQYPELIQEMGLELKEATRPSPGEPTPSSPPHAYRIKGCICGLCITADPALIICCGQLRCITLKPCFAVTCTNRQAVATAVRLEMDLLAQPLPTDDELRDDEYRYRAYRQFVYWSWGTLGQHNRVQLPTCVQMAIRHAFPNQDGPWALTYTGFKDVCLVRKKLLMFSL